MRKQVRTSLASSSRLSKRAVMRSRPTTVRSIKNNEAESNRNRAEVDAIFFVVNEADLWSLQLA